MSVEISAPVGSADDVNLETGMTRAMLRLLLAVGCGAFFILFVIVPFGLRLGADDTSWPASVLVNPLGAVGLWLEGALLCGVAMLATWGLFHVLRRLEPVIDANGLAQGHYLDSLDIRYVDAAIVFSAALSLFIELALIRWQSSVVVFLAFYKNFSLLACFAGLGLGYALATRSRIPLAMVVPLLAAQFCFILLFRLAPNDLSVNPFREQLTMGLQQGDWVEGVALFLLLSVLFLLTALTFVPIGQLCGRLMERRGNLRAYGLNLLGSLLGDGGQSARSGAESIHPINWWRSAPTATPGSR
jgi:hypothetical protein